MSWLTKRSRNVVYTTVFLLIVVIAYIVNSKFRYYSITIELSESAFWLSVPVLISSIITLFLNEKVFNIWRKFTNYCVIISVIIVLITPTSTHGMDFFPIIKETVTIALATVYSTISLILILYKSLKKD